MGNEEPDALVVDVADALTRGREVDWERCARQATAVNRSALDNLRLIAGVFAASRPAEDPPPATAPQSFAGGVARLAARTLLWVAAVQVSAALLLLPWAWDGYRRDLGDLAIYLAVLLVGCALSAGPLLAAGRHDRRTRLLGAYFLLQATLANPFALLASLRGIPQSELFGYPYVYPFLFAPAFLWAFALECPRVRRRSRLDLLVRRMVPVSAAVGCALWVALVECLELARAGYVPEPVFWVVFDGSVAALTVLRLSAVGALVLRARHTSAAEVRRVVVFGGGFLIWVGLDAAYDLVEAFTPGDWLSNYRWSPMVTVVALLRFPGLLLLWYSVLAVRVPHPREVVRATCRRLLARGGPLVVAATASSATLGWLVASRPERAVGSVVADPLVQLLAAATALLLPVTAARRWLLARLDAWVYPETADRQQALADATAELSKADGVATVRRAVSRTAKRVCGSRAALFLPSDSTAEAFIPLDAEMAALRRGSAIVHVLETVGGTMRVHRDDATSDFGMLPPEDAAWAVETDADAVVPVPGPGAELAGVLVVGPRFDGKVVRRVDIPFLETLGAAAGLVLGRLQQPGTGPSDAPSARECSTCGSLAATGDAPQCDCGSGQVETEVPKLLAGKYRLERRLGSGGMGAAYLARDLRLERNVAVKTLREGSVLRLMGLKAEARAMAAASHPAVAEIYGIESWRGRPFLVVEFLPRGTLADRLRRGPVPAPSAVAISVRLADALATLHEAGFLHGDVKPSNVGFTWNGSPKLLDFGLAREMDDPGGEGGTLRYLSPERLSGRPAEEADDVWSLCVMLFEMVSGAHPFAAPGDGVEEVADRVRSRRLAGGALPAASDSDGAAVVAAFAASLLTARRPARPGTARAFADALRGGRPGSG